jgi:hypothetical protein
VLRIDADSEPDRARRAFDTHLARAKWMARTGYRLLLKAGTWSARARLRCGLGLRSQLTDSRNETCVLPFVSRKSLEIGTLSSSTG